MCNKFRFSIIAPVISYMRLLGFTIFPLLVSSAISAQPLHQLNTDDFQGVPDRNKPGVVAYTNSTIDFKYEAQREEGFYRLSFNIRLILNTNRSWLDTRRVTSAAMLDEILKHEQGHYIIAYLEKQELERTVAKTVFYADYRNEAQVIFDRIDAKYKQLNYNYDADTRHMLDREQQANWDDYFKRRLEFAPPES
jgi:hypothetical protein